MKKRFSLMMIMLVLFSSMFVVSCSSDDDSVEVTINSTQDLITYLDGKGMGLDDMLVGWIKTAADVNTIMTDVDLTNDYYIMDIREQALFDKGHIPDAVHSSLATIITDASASGGKTIAVVCYTGQSACHAVVALRLSGYSDAFSIKWGMAGWHTDIDGNDDGDLDDDVDEKFNYWTAGTAQLNHANWVAAPGNATVPTTTYDLPAVTLVGNTDAEIVANRAYWITQNFHKKSATAVLDSVGTDTPFFVVNYWTEQNVTDYGNIDGAYRIYPLDLSLLNPDMPIAVYCWTGQTSSIITAYLGALGYDAWSLGNGANAMIYDTLTANKWDAAAIVDLPLEGTLIP